MGCANFHGKVKPNEGFEEIIGNNVPINYLSYDESEYIEENNFE